MAANVCNSRACLHKGSQEYKGSVKFRPILESAELRSYTTKTPGRYSIRMGREDEIKSSGIEGKGLVLLIICGFYAVLLFILARIATFAVTRINKTVKSMFCRLDITKATVIPKEMADDNNNGVTNQKRLQIRTTTHG